MRIAFGAFELDSGGRRLLHDGAAVRLAPKPFALLEILLTRRPEAVSKDELLGALWEGDAISETALTTVVNDLRRALGERASAPRFVRTVPRFGYAFDGIAHEIEGARPLRGWLLSRRQQIAIFDGTTEIGRAPGHPGTLSDASVSRRHARVLATRASVRIEDLGSKNGSFVNDERVTSICELVDNDLVTIGLVVLRFRSAEAGALAETPTATPPVPLS